MRWGIQIPMHLRRCAAGRRPSKPNGEYARTAPEPNTRWPALIRKSRPHGPFEPARCQLPDHDLRAALETRKCNDACWKGKTWQSVQWTCLARTPRKGQISPWKRADNLGHYRLREEDPRITPPRWASASNEAEGCHLERPGIPTLANQK